MLDLVDNLLRQILVSGISSLNAALVGFQPPNADWRTFVGGHEANLLNVYLFDLRENRKLRSNERVRIVNNGFVSEEPAPTRMDCHYLVSAWSPAAAAPSIEPILDEHALIYRTAALLVRNGSLNPSSVYPANSPELNAWPAAFRNVDLPTVVAPSDGFSKLAEFWSGMGQGSVWKPAIYLIVTVPVALAVEKSGFIVTTTLTEHQVIDRPETAEAIVQIG